MAKTRYLVSVSRTGERSEFSSRLAALLWFRRCAGIARVYCSHAYTDEQRDENGVTQQGESQSLYASLTPCREDIAGARELARLFTFEDESEEA
jgi:hypothetical protein